MKVRIEKILKDYPIETSVVILAFILIVLNPKRAYSGLVYATKNYLNLLPVIIAVALLIGFVSEVLTKEKIAKIIGKESGLKGVLLGTIFGTLMVGPAYVFFPFFKELIDKGANVGVIASTIGSWAIKLQWLPFAIAILGVKYVLIFNLLILAYALSSSIVIPYFVKKTKP